MSTFKRTMEARSARSSTEQGEGQGAEGKPKKRVSFNPVVEYFYYSQLDWMPDELKRLDTKTGAEGRLVSLEDTIYGL